MILNSANEIILFFAKNCCFILVSLQFHWIEFLLTEINRIICIWIYFYNRKIYIFHYKRKCAGWFHTIKKKSQNNKNLKVFRNDSPLLKSTLLCIYQIKSKIIIHCLSAVFDWIGFLIQLLVIISDFPLIQSQTQSSSQYQPNEQFLFFAFCK